MYLHNDNKDEEKKEEEEIKNSERPLRPLCVAGSHLKSHFPSLDTKKSLGRGKHHDDQTMDIRPESPAAEPRPLPRSAGC